jgi:hypothetical protein
MATLKEFEEALKSYNMVSALAVLEKLRDRDRAMRAPAAARRVTAKKMTPDLARQVLELHKTTAMTQQEIAFKLGVNQGRVNEVVKHGKWLTENSAAPERVARDKALRRMREPQPRKAVEPVRHRAEARPMRKPAGAAQLALGDF